MRESQENWKPVVGYEGHYEVSDLGRIRSVTKWAGYGPCARLYHGKVIKQQLDTSGRPIVKLSRHGKKRTHRVHIVVLTAFVGPRPKGCVACHYDDRRGNNRLDNLRWDTRSANAIDAKRNGRMPSPGADCIHCGFKIGIELFDAMKSAARSDGLSFSEWVRRTLVGSLDKSKKILQCSSSVL